MAAAKASKVKARKFPQDEFSIPLDDALDSLLASNDYATVESTDQWTFQADGSTLRITRVRVPEEDPPV
jgi:hypothetical protein